MAYMCLSAYTAFSITMICHYAECHVLFIVMMNVVMLIVVMLSVVKLSVITLSVVMLNGIILSVMAPFIDIKYKLTVERPQPTQSKQGSRVKIVLSTTILLKRSLNQPICRR
jgi:hypothetical protein